jgi:hypothetical protein
MTAKEYLMQLQFLDKKIHNKLSEVYQLRALATSASVAIGSDKVQTSKQKDRMGDAIANIVDKEREANREIKRFLIKKKEIISVIETTENLNHYDLLFKRYVEYKTLRMIQNEMGYSLQHVKRMHKEALDEIKKIKGFEE